MKKFILAFATAASLFGTVPAAAQDYRRDDRREAREDRRDYRHDNRRDRRADRRADNRDWRQYRRYNYNQADPRYGNYYADRYYRDGRYYQPRRLSYNDRVYRGNNGRYYCRRSDGTTGLIIGAGAGALLGNALSNGNSGLLGTLLGAGVGGAIGSSVDRGNVTCR
jgi:Ni/Co efflux regulator RcnB